MTVSAATITELADQAIAQIGSGGMWSLAIREGDAPEQRAELIEVHSGGPARLQVRVDEREVSELVLRVVVNVLGHVRVKLGQRLGETPIPSFHQLTFRRGTIWSARFAPDGHTIVYSAAWDGNPAQLFSTRPESPG